MKIINNLFMAVVLTFYSLNLFSATEEKEKKSFVQKAKEYVRENKVKSAIAAAIIIAGLGGGIYFGYKKLSKQPNVVPPVKEGEKPVTFKDLRKKYLPKLEKARDEIKRRLDRLRTIEAYYFNPSSGGSIIPHLGLVDRKKYEDEAYEIAPEDMKKEGKEKFVSEMKSREHFDNMKKPLQLLRRLLINDIDNIKNESGGPAEKIKSYLDEDIADINRNLKLNIY